MADIRSAPSQLSWSRIARRIRVPLGFVLAAFYLWRARPTSMSVIVGALVALLGILIRAVASGQVEKNQQLATTGPYAYVRNPLYLGSIVLGVGFAIAARDPWVILAIALLFVLIYVPVIRSEEAYLRARFPAYNAYAQRVPSLFPHTLVFRELTPNFSRELYFRHREYNALLGAAALLLAVAAKRIWFLR